MADKYCVDCKFFRLKVDIEEMLCLHPNNIRRDIVTGFSAPASTPHKLREGLFLPFSNCGYLAGWFEPKDVQNG